MVITGLGMVSSLGFSAAAACAAARAGIVRPVPLDYEVVDEDSGNPERVTGHVVGELSAGFTGIGRLIRLGSLAFADLLRNTELTADALSKGTAFLLHTTDHHYDQLHISHMVRRKILSPADAESERELLREAAETHRSMVEKAVIRRILELNGLQQAPFMVGHTYGGAAGFISTLEHARTLLQQGTAKRCIVGAIDSMTDSDLLEKLDDLRLLHSSENPVGFSPGEAAAFLLLEAHDRRRGQKAPPMAVVDSLSLSREEERSRTGGGLATALFACLQETSLQETEINVVVDNANGDEVRGTDFGNALTRMSALSRRADFLRWHVAASFGETGAAAAAVAISRGVQAFARRYAKGPGIAIWLSSDDGQKGALVLRTAEVV